MLEYSHSIKEIKLNKPNTTTPTQHSNDLSKPVTPPQAHPKTSEEEKAMRRYNIDSAVNSVRLEGLVVSDDCLNIFNCFAQGEINVDEMITIVHSTYADEN